MAPDRRRPAGSEPDPGRLTATEIGWLRQLALIVRAAPTDRDRTGAVMIVVRKARAHRATGVRWSDIATALGVTDTTLRRWRRADDAKPTSVPRATEPTGHTRLPGAPDPPAAPHRYAMQTLSAPVSQSRSQHIHSTESAYSRWTSRPTATRTQPGSHTRRVLVVTGDPRPGGNLFGPEAAVIRDRLSSAYVDVRERACIELGELSRELDQLHPSVLHLAAHSAFSGLVLSLDGVAWSVGYDAFAAMIERSFRPQLVVLNRCDSHALSHLLRGLVEALITWPGQTNDDSCRAFAGQLYKALGFGDTVAQAHANSCAALEDQLPHAPLLTGTGHGTALF